MTNYLKPEKASMYRISSMLTLATGVVVTLLNFSRVYFPSGRSTIASPATAAWIGVL